MALRGNVWVIGARYAHLAADHLRGAATRIDGTFSTPIQKPQLVRLS